MPRISIWLLVVGLLGSGFAIDYLFARGMLLEQPAFPAAIRCVANALFFVVSGLILHLRGYRSDQTKYDRGRSRRRFAAWSSAVFALGYWYVGLVAVQVILDPRIQSDGQAIPFTLALGLPFFAFVSLIAAALFFGVWIAVSREARNRYFVAAGVLLLPIAGPSHLVHLVHASMTN